MLFTLMRLATYAGVLLWVLLHGHHPWWHWVLAAAAGAWGTWDRWKRPDDPLPELRLGVWSEGASILLLALAVGDNALLFLGLSPLMRSSVHLPVLETAALALAEGAAICLLHLLHPGLPWLPWAEAGALLLLGPYAYVLGTLLRQQATLRRQVALAALEREQRARDEQRMQMAAQLHDVMGQYWTAVIRGLDVAQATDGQVAAQFIARAREAALQGLEEMRGAVHDWHAGRQGPDDWLQTMHQAIARFRETVGLRVTLQAAAEIPWPAFADPTRTAEAVARTVMEALTNAVRHGGATAATVTLQTDRVGLTAIIHDDGHGLRQDATPGLGLRSLRDLAADLGGTCTLTPGRGATITLRLPYEGGDA